MKNIIITTALVLMSIGAFSGEMGSGGGPRLTGRSGFRSSTFNQERKNAWGLKKGDGSGGFKNRVVFKKNDLLDIELHSGLIYSFEELKKVRKFSVKDFGNYQILSGDFRARSINLESTGIINF